MLSRDARQQFTGHCTSSMGISVKGNDLHDVCSTESDRTPHSTYSPDPKWASFFLFPKAWVSNLQPTNLYYAACSHIFKLHIYIL